MWYNYDFPCPPALKSALTGRECADVLARAQQRTHTELTVGADDTACSETLRTALASIKKINKIPKQGCVVSAVTPLAVDGVSMRDLFDCNFKALRSSTQHPEQRFAMECYGYDWVTIRIVCYVIAGVGGCLAVCLLVWGIGRVCRDDKRRRKHARCPVAAQQPLPERDVTSMKNMAPSVAVTHDAYVKMLPNV